MGGTGRRRIEDVVDEALQSLLDGEPAETILARYPGFEAELTSLLFAADALKDAPHPQLSQASIAAMVNRAEAQVARDKNVAAPMLLPAVEANSEVENASRTPHAKSTTGQTRPARQTWQERVKAWFSPASGLLRIPTALAAVAVVIIALFTITRFIDKPEPPYPPVPTLTAQFTMDGTIERVANGMWTVDGGMVYLDSHTVVTGTPMIGSQAHIEGDIASDNRRIARSIIVTQPAASTATPRREGIASATPQLTPTVIIRTEEATQAPTAMPTPALPPTSALPEIAQASPTTSGSGIQPSPTIPAPATIGAKPTPIAPTRTIVVLPTTPKVVPTITESIATPQPTMVKQPSPEPTGTMQPSPTARPVEPTATAIPQPELTATIEVEPSHTPKPQETRTPEPTSEPEDTPRPHSTATVHTEPTSTVEPEETSTALPTTTVIPTTEPEETSTALPTTQPTIPPLSSPTRTEEPHETETAEPTHGPESTRTVELTRTPKPTHTEGR